MATRIPVVKQYAWLSALPQLLILAIVVAVTSRLVEPAELAISVGAFAYLVYAFAVRRLLAWSHRKGIRLVKAGRFAEAIPEFEASYQFFTRHLWIDNWRYLTLLSSSSASYREMALCNMGFCSGQLGDGKKSKRYYQQTLQEFPESGLATAALNLILAGENAAS